MVGVQLNVAVCVLEKGPVGACWSTSGPGVAPCSRLKVAWLHHVYLRIVALARFGAHFQKSAADCSCYTRCCTPKAAIGAAGWHCWNYRG